MKKRKTPKNRPYRSALDNALWSFREILKQAPVCFLLMALEVPLNVCLSFTEVYLPALVVAEFTGGAPLSRGYYTVSCTLQLS